MFSSISGRRLHRDPAVYRHPLTGARSTEYVEGYRFSPREAFTPRQTNPTNPILDAAREDDWSDPWGTALAWMFPCCGVLELVDPSRIALGWGYRSSAFGAVADLEEDGYPGRMVLEVLGLWVPDPDGEGGRLIDLDSMTADELELRAAWAAHAAGVFDRIVVAARAAGRDY